MFKKVLVLYVGGTIGMQKNEKGVYIPVANTFLHKIKYHSELHDTILAQQYFGHLRENELVLPKFSAKETIIYEIVEYLPLLDSSNMSCKEWIRIAKDIELHYNKYNGFVILHGTDTLAYTSSALSFMLEGLEKPVIITGSQIPVFETRSDAKDNFLLSLIIAGCYNIPEVCVVFANKLFRGNRVEKFSSNELDAFTSPNYHTLADVGIEIKIHERYIRQVNPNTPFKVHSKLNPNVAKLGFFPTLTCQMLEAFLQPPVEALILETYGAGNIPSNRIDLLDTLKKAIKRHIIVVNITQCTRGRVIADYEAGKVLEEIGIVLGEDMTAIAALTKLTYILNLPDLTFKQRCSLMKRDLRGEMTMNEKCSCS